MEEEALKNFELKLPTFCTHRDVDFKNMLNALEKISIYDASAKNYNHAWNLLIESYDKKRGTTLKTQLL